MFDEKLLVVFLEQFETSKWPHMTGIYIASFEHHIKICKDAVGRQDKDRLQRSAHDLKSLCRTLGATEPGEMARAIELNIMEGREAKAYAEVPALIMRLEQIITVIKSKCEQGF